MLVSKNMTNFRQNPKYQICPHRNKTRGRGKRDGANGFDKPHDSPFCHYLNNLIFYPYEPLKTFRMPIPSFVLVICQVSTPLKCYICLAHFFF